MVAKREMCVSADLDSLAGIARFVTAMAVDAGLSDDDVYDVQMAVDEACTNSIEHAYGGTGGVLRVCCFVEGDDFVVRITDFGRPFRPDAVPEPDLTCPIEERGVGGLGLFFMKQLMDSVSFTFSAQEGNRVVMRKSRGGQPA